MAFRARSFRVGVAAIGVAFVLAIALGASGLPPPSAQRTAAGSFTTLTIISGVVSVRSSGRDFAAAADGAVLAVGDTVRTGADGRAVLTYFEGTTVEIEPSSELAIDAAGLATDGSTVILMTQSLGRTWHVVTHLLSGNSRYEVRTPASTASVRGTQFEVTVADDATTVTTSEGRVATSDPANTAEVLVTPGLTTTTRQRERPAPPVPAPDAERRVTVTVAEPNALVVDPLGRANGFKDGTLVMQTPGASVRIVGGKLIVTLLDMPDGTLAAHAGQTKTGGTDVETTVEERGRAPVSVRGRSGSDGGAAAVEVQRVSGSAPKVTPKGGALPAPKVGVIPAGPAEPTEAPDSDRAGAGPRPGATERPIEPGRLPGARAAKPARTPEPARRPGPVGTPRPTRGAEDRPQPPAANGPRPSIQLHGTPRSPATPTPAALPRQTAPALRDRPGPAGGIQGRP